MPNALLKDLLTKFRPSGLGQYFPTPYSFTEACSWRGPELHVGRDGVALFAKGGPVKDLSQRDPVAVGTAPRDLANQLRGLRSLAVSFSDTLTFSTVAEIPTTTAEKTNKILALRRLHLLPKSEAHYLHGWYEEAGETGGHLRQIHELVLRKDYVEDILRETKEFGAVVKLLFIRSEQLSAFPVAWNVDGRPYKTVETRNWIRFQSFGLAFAVIALVAFGGAKLFERITLGRTLDAAVKRLEPLAQQLTKKRETTEKYISQMKLLESLAGPEGLVSTKLEHLARTLEDDVVLTGIIVERNVTTIEGMASFPEKLIEVLQSSGNFRQIAFTAPVFRNPGEAKSRFAIQLISVGSK